jgi:hypothetical protein
MPQLNVQPVDLVEQHQNRPTCGGELFTAYLAETLAPAAQRLEFLRVEAGATDGRFSL